MKKMASAKIDMFIKEGKKKMKEIKENPKFQKNIDQKNKEESNFTNKVKYFQQANVLAFQRKKQKGRGKNRIRALYGGL